MYTIVHDVHMFDIVHERCAKFNTRRMARMGILYYTILYDTILTAILPCMKL